MFIYKNDKSQKKKKYDIEGSKSIMESEINIKSKIKSNNKLEKKEQRENG